MLKAPAVIFAIRSAERVPAASCAVKLRAVSQARNSELLREQGETAWTMGEIVPRRDAPVEWS